MNIDGVETATQTLHRLTSYDPEHDWDEVKDDPRLLRDFVSNDVDRRPLFTKRYGHGLPRTPLPRDLPVTATSALEVLAGTVRPDPVPLDPAGLGRLLHLSAGVVRESKRESWTFLYRAAGSAGGRFPLELYVAVPDGAAAADGLADLPPGVHWYDPVEHALVQVGPPPGNAGPEPAAPTVIVTGVPWRTGWRYRERGFRHVYWDAGTMLSQLLALADSGGLAPRLHTRFPDAGVASLVGADQVHEWPVALVTLGDGVPAIDVAVPAAAGEVDTAPLEFPLVTAAQRAGDMDRLAEPWQPGAAVDVDVAAVAAAAVAGPGGQPPSLDEVIGRRGSQRRMDAERGLPLDTLRTCMTLALRGIDVGHWIAVHDVAGLAPGIYPWPDLDKPIRTDGRAEMRAELYRVCLEQSLGRDAAFVVMAATDVSRLSDREYREAQLAAGIVEGRLHLAAYALGAGATGMTFLDSEIPALLGAAQGSDTGPEPLDGLIFTCVGVPANTSRPGGSPGTPTRIRAVAPRE
jgi:SagB-type dehydrogenase family enzyme